MLAVQAEIAREITSAAQAAAGGSYAAAGQALAVAAACQRDCSRCSLPEQSLVELAGAELAEDVPVAGRDLPKSRFPVRSTSRRTSCRPTTGIWPLPKMLETFMLLMVS